MAFQIIRNDITKVTADAIVNSANPEPIFASGTDKAIYEAAGAEELLEERRKIGNIETGQAAATPAFALDAKYIIHTVGPAWWDGQHGEKEAVRKCYENSLKLAGELGCESIAFPLIATGVYGFPKADALKIAVSVFSEFLTVEDMQIILVVFDEDSFVLSGKIFSDVDAFIDENYVSEQIEEEYGESHPESETKEVSERRRRNFFHRPEAFPGSKPLSQKAARMDRILEEDAVCASADFAEEPVMAAPAAAMASASKTGRSLDDIIAHVGETWQESLLRLIDEKGYKDTEVYKRANVDRKLFSKIRSNTDYQPKKITAIAFALALRLSLDETRDLLRRAGYALSPGNKFDLIIEYFIRQEVYDTYTINLALFEHKQPLLGE